MTVEPAPHIVAAVADLMFGSKIRAAADSSGVEVTFVRSLDALRAEAARASLLLLDLDTRWLDAPAAIRMLKEDPATKRARIVAFGPHVDGPALIAARQAGADRVMARSAFVAALPTLLRDGLT